MSDLSLHRLLPGDELPSLTGNSDAWVSDLERVSGDGRALLLRIGVMRPLEGG